MTGPIAGLLDEGVRPVRLPDPVFAGGRFHGFNVKTCQCCTIFDIYESRKLVAIKLFVQSLLAPNYVLHEFLSHFSCRSKRIILLFVRTKRTADSFVIACSIFLTMGYEDRSRTLLYKVVEFLRFPIGGIVIFFSNKRLLLLFYYYYYRYYYYTRIIIIIVEQKCIFNVLLLKNFRFVLIS